MYPDLLSEQELAYYSAYACVTLEHLLAGEPLAIGDDAPLPEDSAAVAEGVAEDAAPGQIQESDSKESRRGLPPALTEMSTPPFAEEKAEEELLWPEEESVHDVGSIPCWTQPVVESPAVDNNLLALQQEYMAMGCTLNPDSHECRNSGYAQRIEAETENFNAW